MNFDQVENSGPWRETTMNLCQNFQKSLLKQGSKSSELMEIIFCDIMVYKLSSGGIGNILSLYSRTQWLFLRDQLNHLFQVRGQSQIPQVWLPQYKWGYNDEESKDWSNFVNDLIFLMFVQKCLTVSYK